MSMKMKMKKYDFPSEEIGPRALGIYLAVSLWIMGPHRHISEIGNFYYVMMSFSKEFERIAKSLAQEGKADESRIYKDCSKRLHRFLGTIRQEESEQLIVFLIWLISRELAEYNIRFSETLRRILFKKDGINIIYNVVLSEKDLLAREEMLKKYDQCIEWNIFIPGGAFPVFTTKLVKTMLSIEGDITKISNDYLKVITPFVLSLLTPESPLRVFIQEGIHFVEETVLDVDIKLVNQLIDGISKACKEDLGKIYEVHENSQTSYRNLVLCYRLAYAFYVLGYYIWGRSRIFTGSRCFRFNSFYSLDAFLLEMGKRNDKGNRK